jgi:hypothetical protein
MWLSLVEAPQLALSIQKMSNDHALAVHIRGKSGADTQSIYFHRERRVSDVVPKKLTCQANFTTGAVDAHECGSVGADKHAATIGCPVANLSDASRPQNTEPRRSNRTYVFLLGYPFSGTSAVHFLLATSPFVSTIRDPGLLGPSKEGWAQKFGRHAGNFSNQSFKRWFKNKGMNSHHLGGVIPWKKLDRLYHRKWNLSKPILLENSPPEVDHAQHLYEQFSHHGEVRFIVLVRSPCNIQVNQSVDQTLNRLQHFRSITEHFGKRVFVLRYEDICTNSQQLANALEAWLPGLGQMDASTVPSALAAIKPTHSHVPLSIPTYCKEYGLPEWPHSTEAFSEHTGDQANSLFRFFGYNVRSE